MVFNKDINWIHAQIQNRHENSKGVEQSILKEILGLFETAPDNVVLLNTDGLSDDDIFRLVHQASRNAVLLPGGSCEPSIELVEPEKWIPVAERLPKEQSEAWYNIVLTRTQDGKRVVKLGYWDGYHKRFYGFDKPGNYCVTHWMPLPEPPKEDADGNL